MLPLEKEKSQLSESANGVFFGWTFTTFWFQFYSSYDKEFHMLTATYIEDCDVHMIRQTKKN